LTTINLAGILDGIKSNLNEKEQESFRNAVAKIIYNSLTSLDSNSGNLLAAIADSIIDLNEGTIGYE
jgi:hypothetical protein